MAVQQRNGGADFYPLLAKVGKANMRSFRALRVIKRSHIRPPLRNGQSALSLQQVAPELLSRREIAARGQSHEEQ
jgi:hypothetical protein